MDLELQLERLKMCCQERNAKGGLRPTIGYRHCIKSLCGNIYRSNGFVNKHHVIFPFILLEVVMLIL